MTGGERLYQGMEQVESLDFKGNRRFRIMRRLGEGGMGVVYEALDREQNATVALKALPTSNAAAVMRFKREFRALQNVRHANLVTLGEMFEDRGTWFFTMKLIHGVPCLDYVMLDRARVTGNEDTQSVFDVPRSPPHARAPFHEERLRSCLGQLARGLTALHGAGKIHRDVKPSNTLVDAKGHLFLLDFGLVADAESDQQWSDDRVVGTIAYMAPEQAAGRRVGPEADWYAVGVLLYEALTGTLPFCGTGLQVLLDKQQTEPEPPSSVTADIPDDLDELCMDLLCIEPTRRPNASSILRRLGEA